MQGTESVSKGCFGFRPQSPSGKKRSKPTVPNPLKIFSNEIWHQGYKHVWDVIENKLGSVDDDVTESLLNDLISFITTSKGNDQIPTAAILTGINLPDHGVLFGRLIRKIENERKLSHSVALLSSTDCSSVKHAIERTVSHLISEKSKESELSEEEDSFDDSEDDDDKEKCIKKSDCTMPALLKWYRSKKVCSPNKKVKFNIDLERKLIIIIKDFESIAPKILQTFIHILSGYINHLPIVLVLGIATTLSSIYDTLNHSTISRLALKSFQSQPSVYFLNNTLNKVFLSPECPLQLSVNRFTQGIKYCVMEHFREGGSLVGLLCCLEEDLEENVSKMSHTDLEDLRRLKTFKAHVERSKDSKVKEDLLNDDNFTKKVVLKLMQQLRRRIKEFYLFLNILHHLVSQLPGTPLGFQLRELYATAMTKDITKTEDYNQCRNLLEFQAKDQLISKIDKVIMLIEANKPLLESVHEKLVKFRDKLENAGLTQIMKSPVKTEIKKRSQLKQKVMEMGTTRQTEFELARKEVLDYIMYDALCKGLQPPSTAPMWCLWELVILVETEARHRVVSRMRAPIHVALSNPHHYLQCTCCKIDSEDQILPSMPDICIVYKLHLESGSLINMYDWLQSFNLIVSPDGKQGEEIDQKIQARFTQAVAELEFLGFIKSSKRKSDHMERLTWGGPLINHSVNF